MKMNKNNLEGSLYKKKCTVSWNDTVNAPSAAAYIQHQL